MYKHQSLNSESEVNQNYLQFNFLNVLSTDRFVNKPHSEVKKWIEK
jgi:hypothetical protein